MQSIVTCYRPGSDFEQQQAANGDPDFEASGLNPVFPDATFPSIPNRTRKVSTGIPLIRNLRLLNLVQA
jgi:hypothetical protein